MEIPPGAPLRHSSTLRLLFELGRGGMGVVYLAVAKGDAGFTKLKVVKRLRAELALDPRAVSMFLDEARLAARLQHPNIVQTNEVGSDGRHPFMEMEYLEGQSLDALRRRAGGHRRIPLELSLWILGQVLAGLDYAHDLADIDGTPLGIVHRDVSPHNVMLTYAGAVKLLDFGIAKVVDSTIETQSGVVKGKATYMAPEQATRGAVDRRADLFAAGVMLWEAISGERFWGDASEFDIFLRLREGKLPAVPAAPEPLAAMCARALALSPDDRYPTAAAMLADLDAYLAAHSSVVGPRALAKLLADLFQEQREATRREIEERSKGDSPPDTQTVPDVPLLRTAVEDASRSAGATSVTKLQQRSEIRGLRRIATGAIALAVVASVSVVMVSWRAGVRARSPASLASAVASSQGCTTNRACTEKVGRAAMCRHGDGACAPLESDGCKLLAEPGDAEDDRALFVGAMFPVSGPLAKPIGEPCVRAVDLARRDFVEVARGLPSTTGDAPSRPIVVVRCDDATDSAKAAHHLVDDLRVPAVIGFASSNDLIDLTEKVFVPAHVLAVPAMNTSALITSVPQPPGERLVFRTSLSNATKAEPAATLIENLLEPQRRAQLGGTTRPLRLAFLRRASASGLAIGNAFFAALRLNGKGGLANSHDGAYAEISVSEPSDKAAADSFAAAAKQLLAFVPDMVVYAGGDELTNTLFRPLEAGWPRGAPRPVYVALNSLAGPGAAFFEWLGHDASLRRRFIGIAPTAATQTNVLFTMRYNQAYPDAPTTTNLSPAAAYDAFYLVAYAAFVAGEGAAHGSDLARAISRLMSPGERIDVGPTSIFEAVRVLRSAEHIDLNGAGNPLDFDLATGESQADYDFVCPGVTKAGAADLEVESGLSYSSTEHVLEGTLRCP